MAIGFSYSSVVGIAIDEEENAIYYELRNVRYKFIIDDEKTALDTIAAIQSILAKNKVAKAKKPRDLPDFYKN